jgi:hypothetical protein
MDPTLIFAALTGLDRAREQFDHPAPTWHGRGQGPAIHGSHRRLWRRGGPNGRVPDEVHGVRARHWAAGV